MGRGNHEDNDEALELPLQLAVPSYRPVWLRGSAVLADLDGGTTSALDFDLAFDPPLDSYDPANPTYAKPGIRSTLHASPFGPYLQINSRELDRSFYCGLQRVPLCPVQPCIHLELYRLLEHTHGAVIEPFLYDWNQGAKVLQPYPWSLRITSSYGPPRDLIALCDDVVFIDGDASEDFPARSQACVMDFERCARHAQDWPEASWLCVGSFFAAAADWEKLPERALLRPALIDQLVARDVVDLRTGRSRPMTGLLSAALGLSTGDSGSELRLHTGPISNEMNAVLLASDDLDTCGLCADFVPELDSTGFPCARHPQLSRFVAALRAKLDA